MALALARLVDLSLVGLVVVNKFHLTFMVKHLFYVCNVMKLKNIINVASKNKDLIMDYFDVFLKYT